MYEVKAEVNYKDIKKHVVFYFQRPAALMRFMSVCIGDRDSAAADFKMTPELATECSKANTLAITYGIKTGSAAMLRDLYNYHRIVKGEYHITVNGVNYTCRPVITLTPKRGD